MVYIDPEKLHVVKLDNGKKVFPRRYTLTHSDSSGDLYLTIAPDYNKKQISGLYTRFMRDEVLAEWLNENNNPQLHVYCHVIGGLVFGGKRMRESIFRREMPLVLTAFRMGDADFITENPDFDNSQVIIHYQKAGKDYLIENFGKLSEYK